MSYALDNDEPPQTGLRRIAHAETWIVWDNLAAMPQLGLMPPG